MRTSNAARKVQTQPKHVALHTVNNFPVRKNIPMPTIQRELKNDYMLEELTNEGDSKFIPGLDEQNRHLNEEQLVTLRHGIYAQIQRIRKITGNDYSMRKVEENGVHGFGVWLTQVGRT